MKTGPLLIGVSSRIYTPGSVGINAGGIWTKNLHYLEQSVAHWVLSGHAMAVMIPAVTRDSIITRSDLDLDDYARICSDAEVLRYVSGRPLTRAEAWRQIAMFLGRESGPLVSAVPGSRC